MDVITLLSIAGDQHSVLSHRQALAAGVTKAQLHRATRSGLLTLVAPQVYAIAHLPRTRRTEITIGCLTYDGAASHQTAAELWELLSPRDQRVHVITTRWDRVLRAELAVHESRDLIDEDIATLDGIPVTTPTRTLVDLGAEVAPQAVEIAFETGVRKGLLDAEQVARLVRRVARRGRRGVGAIRPLLAQRERWDGLTESALEDRFRRLLVEHGIPSPTPQYVVMSAAGAFVCRADFAYPEHRLLIELDSERYHMDRMTFRSDRAKQNQATVEGWTTLRYTWFDISRRPWDVCAEIRSLCTGVPGSR